MTSTDVPSAATLSPEARSKGWRRYLTGQRLRLFIFLSLALHVVLGLSWGVPAYVKQRRVEALRHQQELALEARRKDAETTHAQAKAHDLAQTTRDVETQTRKMFDKLTGDLREPEKEKTWEAVHPKLQPAEQHLATALDDHSMTEQDLRNLQADVDRQLVQAVNTRLTEDVAREEVDSFLAAVEAKVVPELVELYKRNTWPTIADPVRKAADHFVQTTREDTTNGLKTTDADRTAVDNAVQHLGEGLDLAGMEVDIAQSLATRKPPAPDAEIKQHLDSAAKHLTEAAEQADAMLSHLKAVVDHIKPLVGATPAISHLASNVESVTAIRKAIQGAQTAVAAKDLAASAKQITGGALSQRRLWTQRFATWDSVFQSQDLAQQSAQVALGNVKDTAIPHNIDSHLADAFRKKASPRLTNLMNDALTKRLTAAGAKQDPALVASTISTVKILLESKVGSAGGYGETTTRTLRDVAGTAKPSNPDEHLKLADQFIKTADPLIVAGAAEIVSDTSLDARLLELVSKPDHDTGREEVRDRIAMLAARAADGRTTTVDAVSLTDLRASALARSTQTDRDAAAGGATDAGAPTTAPVDAPPVIDDLKKEILASLKQELDKLLQAKLTDDQAKKLWDHVAKKSDGDVNRLAQDLIDPNVSDADLESRRLDFSGKFLASVREGLDKAGSEDVAKAIVEQLKGKAGDNVASAFRDAVRENVGGNLAREWRGAAEGEWRKTNQQVRDASIAIDSARTVAEKASQLLEQTKNEADRVAHDGKGDASVIKPVVDAGRAKLQQIQEAMKGAKSDLDKGTASVPAQTPELKTRLDELGKSFEKIDSAITQADKTAAAADPAAFADAVAEARKHVDALREGLGKGREGLDKAAQQAEAQITKAEQEAGNDSAGGPGVKSRIQAKFNEQFRKEALPGLADQIVKNYQKKLEQSGVTADGEEQASFRKAVADALDKKVTGEGRVGEAAIGDLEKQNFFDHAKLSETQPTKEQVAQVNALADKVTTAGVGAAVHGDAGTRTAGGAMEGIEGASKDVVELKTKVDRLEGQLRGGRGGVLAEGEANDGQGAGGVQGLRRKWQGILAGLNGNGEGEEGAGGNAQGSANGGHGSGRAGGGRGGAGGVASAAGAGSGTAGAGGAGAGSGRAGGAGGASWIKGSGYGDRGRAFDEAKHNELTAFLKERAAQKGQAWQRQGADGEVAAAEGDAFHPARIVAPSSQPSAPIKNDQPYAPTFKSLQFAVIPYLNKSMTVADNFDAWKDIPAIHLRPERSWIKEEGLKVLDDIPLKVAWDGHGMYFMLDMTDADGKISKTQSNTFWHSDCLEVFIDTMNTKELQRGNGAGQQFWFWPFGSATDNTVPGGESYYERQTGFHYFELKPGELPRFARQTPAGYIMQSRVPIERVRDADLAPGKILGFNATIETGSTLHYYWSASKAVGTSVHPDTWGDILLGGSDGKIEFPSKLDAEGDVAAARKIVSAFVVGQPLRVRVTDRDMNLNDKVRDKVSVTVRNARKEREVVILEETGPDTGVFEGSLRTALALGEHTPGVISVYEGETLSVSYIDQARANGARNAEITSRIMAGPSVMMTK